MKAQIRILHETQDQSCPLCSVVHSDNDDSEDQMEYGDPQSAVARHKQLPLDVFPGSGERRQQ